MDIVIPIKVATDLRFIKQLRDPDITVMLDDKVLVEGLQTIDHRRISFYGILDHGDHVLQIQYHNMFKASPDDGDKPVVIDRVFFQNIDHDFKIYSRYRPDYPDTWRTQQQNLNLPCADEIHSNYLGWNGIWSLEFQVPIYRWCHQKLGLGWLA